MKNILNIELTSYHKTLLWILSISALFAKVLLECILFWFNQFNTPFSIFIRFALSLLTALPVILIFYFTFKEKINEWMSSKDYFFKETIQLLFFNFVLLIFSVFLPKSIISGGTPKLISEIITINVFAFLGLYVSLYSYNFIVKWLWIRRFSKTKIYLKIIFSMTFIFILVIELPELFHHLYPEEIRANSYLMAFSIIFNLSLIVIGWMAAGKSSWIAHLKLSEKWKLVGLSLIVLILEGILFISEMKNEGDGTISNAMYYIVPSGTLLGISSILLMIYFLRNLFSSFLTMPASGIIEKKSTELSSITYLNRLVSQTIDLDNLIDSVTKLALYSSGALAVWTDIKDKNQKRIIKSCEHMNNDKFTCESISDELTRRFYSNLSEIKFVDNLKEPLYIESIRDSKNASINEVEKILNAKSLIIMPLLSGNDKIGTLYLAHSEEYGFEPDYLNILRAFSDNINIAIENIRLLEISIEQERYKKELMIARDIENRLIPEHLPAIKNYSVAGLTIQAEEVGGDYFELVYLKDGAPCLLIADVSGKGLSAAFYMVLLKGVVISVANQSSSPKMLLQNINNILYKQMENKIFITMSAIKINDDKGKITIGRAGHMPFFLVRKNEIYEYKPSGLGIGLSDHSIFDKNMSEQEIQLEQNDLFVMYSDGLTEMSIEDTESGEEFLKQILKKSVYNNSEDVLNDIKSETEKIRQKSKINDDMTIVSLIYHQDNVKVN